MVGVYKITNLITGDFYIGQSKNIYKRIYNHRYPGIHSKNFESDIQKYGWKNFKVEVIEECAESDLLEREAYYIDRLHPVYNFIVRGRTIPEDTKAKIRKKLIGLKQSPETIAKRKQSIRERHLIIPQTNESHRKRVMVDILADNAAPIEFESVKAAAEFFGVHPSTVTKALKSGHKVHGHPVWYAV